MDHVSMLKIYSIGIAAENKGLKTRELKITPNEKLPFLDGELKPSATPMGFSGNDAQGQKYEGNVITDNVITATWLPLRSNRVSPPDVRRGERVIVYRYAAADKYYWCESGLDDHLRKLETIIFAISATPDESVTTISPETHYFLEFSAHLKRVTFQTSKKNGEVVTHKVQFDPGVGTITVNDDLGNEVFVNGPESLVRLKNSSNCSIALDKENLHVVVPQKMDVTAGSLISLKVGGSQVTITPGNIDLKSATISHTKG